MVKLTLFIQPKIQTVGQDLSLGGGQGISTGKVRKTVHYSTDFRQSPKTYIADTIKTNHSEIGQIRMGSGCKSPEASKQRVLPGVWMIPR